MRQVLSWALARSPGLRSLAWARLAAFCAGGLFQSSGRARHVPVRRVTQAIHGYERRNSRATSRSGTIR